MNLIMTGAIAMAFAVAALFFFKFWSGTRDRLFALFAVSFFILAINRVALGIAVEQGGRGEYSYWVRLIAFAIILAGIVDKNRSRTRQ
jgi:hypothetical protein